MTIIVHDDLRDMEVIATFDEHGVKIKVRTEDVDGSIEFPPELSVLQAVEIFEGSAKILSKHIPTRSSDFVREWNKLADRFQDPSSDTGAKLRMASALLDLAAEHDEPVKLCADVIRILMSLDPTGSWHIAKEIERE